MNNGLPVRPSNKAIQHRQFLWTYVNPTFTKFRFKYRGKTYSNPTAPLRIIHKEEGLDGKPSRIKGWYQTLVLIRQKLEDPKPSWYKFNRVITPTLRKNSKKMATSKPAPKATKKRPASPAKKSPKKKQAKVQEEKPTRRLSAAKVLGYTKKYEVIEIPDEIHYDTLGLALNRAALRNVMTFDTEETIEVIKHINEIIRKREDGSPVIDVPQGKEEESQSESESEDEEMAEVEAEVPEKDAPVEQPAPEPASEPMSNPPVAVEEPASEFVSSEY
jgi:hypothetical protein